MIRKFIIFFIFFTFSAIPVKAQLDLEHWFPPFFQSVSGTAISEIKIYLSTDKTQPFKVNIYNHNQLIDSVTLSNAQPIEYTLKDDSMIRTNVAKRTMSATTMGIYIAGEQSFYASLRVQDTYSEIMASKGKSALGKEFYVVNDQVLLYESPNEPPNTLNAPKMNYQASILATEDNTKIKVFNYNKNLTFIDGSTDDITNIILNKGEAYIIAALKKDNKDPNPPHPVLDDNDPNLIGAKIISDKPIVVNNGNFLSQDIGDSGGNINLDQSVPTTKIGKEYFVVNGMTVVEASMEKVIIVATKDNTEVFFNNETKSTVTLNEGKYFLGPFPNKFLPGSEQTFVNAEPKQVPTKGMYIRTSKPAYVFQLIGGYNDMPKGPVTPQTGKTSGMTFSYPLDIDYYPHEKPNLIQVPSVERIGKFRNDVKITVKSPEAAKIYVNGFPLPSGSEMHGKNGWKYNTLLYQVGDVNISSDKSLNIDVVGGKPFTGFASSYTGFSNDPYITKNGRCIEETVILSVSNINFEKIQWQLNGIDIPGANSPTFLPSLAGTYRCKLIYAYGDFSYFTNEIFVDKCPYLVTEKIIDNICSGKDFTILPQFSPPNTKFEVIKTEIITPPIQGEAKVIDTDISVKISESFSGENRIVYKITADNGFYEIITAKFKVYEAPNFPILSPIDPIGIDKNKFIYNLLQSTVLNDDNSLSLKFYKTNTINASNEISSPKNFITTQKSVFLKITNTNNCSKIVEVKLNQPELPPTNVPDTAEFPNTFTPNNDGYNDFWNFQSLENYLDLQVMIFDKHGSKVYQYTVGKPFYWDGKDLSNRKLPTGTYWAILKGINPEKNEILNKSMWIYLKNR